MGKPIDAFDPPVPLSGPGAVEGTSGAAARANHNHGSVDLSAIKQGGATSNQVLTWNGTTWAPATASGGSDTTGFRKDSFTASGSTGTWVLSYLPLTDSLHIYNGSSVLVEGTNYSLSGNTVSITSGISTGNALVARYAYNTSSPLGGGNTYVTQILSTTPNAMWLLNETSGTAMLDSSGNGRNGTYSTLPTKATSLIPSYSGQCNSYAASTRNGDIPYASWLTSSAGLSLEFWTSTTYSPGAVGVILDRLLDGTSIIETWAASVITGGFLQLLWYDAAGSIRSVNGSTVINDGVARQHVITHDGNQTIKFYINGALDVTRTQGTGLWTGVNGQGSMRIADGFTHKTQAVSHWSRALSAAEVAANYAASQ